MGTRLPILPRVLNARRGILRRPPHPAVQIPQGMPSERNSTAPAIPATYSSEDPARTETAMHVPKRNRRRRQIAIQAAEFVLMTIAMAMAIYAILVP